MRRQKGKTTQILLFFTLVVCGIAGLILLQKYRTPIPAAPAASPSAALPASKKPSKSFAKPEPGREEKEEQDLEALNRAMLTGQGCAEIRFNEDKKKTCEDSLLYNSAIAKTDINMCGKIQDEPLKKKCLDAVYLNLAILNADNGLCEKIENSELKQNCLDRFQASLGKTAASAEVCDTISDPALKRICLDDFHFAKAVEGMSAASCAAILDGGRKDQCSKTVEKNIQAQAVIQKQAAAAPLTTGQKLESCGSLSEMQAESCRNAAHFDLAKEKKDIGYCNPITDPSLKQACVSEQGSAVNRFYLNQAVAKKDPSFCDKISDSSLKSMCLTYAK